MTTTFDVWLSALPVLLVLALLGWLVSLALRSAIIPRLHWGFMILAACVSYALDSDPRAPRLASVPILVLFWLGAVVVHLVTRRSGDDGERRAGDLKSLYRVFLPLALLAWIVSLPLLGALSSNRPTGPFDHIGRSLFIIGVVFELAVDGRLTRFRPRPADAAVAPGPGRSRVGRDANHIGEALIWWSFWFMALGAGAWWALPGPIVMSLLALRASHLRRENDTGNSRPGYADYVLKTNAFFPARRRN